MGRQSIALQPCSTAHLSRRVRNPKAWTSAPSGKPSIVACRLKHSSAASPAASEATSQGSMFSGAAEACRCRSGHSDAASLDRAAAICRRRARRHQIRPAAAQRAVAAAGSGASAPLTVEQQGSQSSANPPLLDVCGLTAAVTPTGRGAAARKAAAAVAGRQVLQVRGPQRLAAHSWLFNARRLTAVRDAHVV